MLDALNRPHPSLKFTLSPSIVIFSHSNRDSLINLSTISNLFSSVTVIFNSGVENESGNFENISEIDSLDFDNISAALIAAYGPSSKPYHLSLKKICQLIYPPNNALFFLIAFLI